MGIPLYIILKDFIGVELAANLMVVVMLPFFVVAMYEKDGMLAEKILSLMIWQKYILKGKRECRLIQN